MLDAPRLMGCISAVFAEILTYFLLSDDDYANVAVITNVAGAGKSCARG